MRRLIPLLCFLIPVLFLTYSCEDTSNDIGKDLTVADVRMVYDELSGKQLPGGRKEPIEINWEQARYKDISVGDALVFPLKNVANKYISGADGGVLYPVQQRAYAFAYKG